MSSSLRQRQQNTARIGMHAYSQEQINKLLSVCNLRSRAIVLIYCSTGIRLSALPPIKLRHIQKLGDIYKFTVYENDEQYYTRCTPEMHNPQ